MSSLMLKCSCSCEMLEIQKDTDIHSESLYFLSMFKNAYGWKYTFTQRLRHIWQIITKGHPYTDSMVLTKEHMLTLKNWIEQQETV